MGRGVTEAYGPGERQYGEWTLPAVGPAVELQVLTGIDHFEHLDPGSGALDPVRDALEDI